MIAPGDRAPFAARQAATFAEDAYESCPSVAGRNPLLLGGTVGLRSLSGRLLLRRFQTSAQRILTYISNRRFLWSQDARPAARSRTGSLRPLRIGARVTAALLGRGGEGHPAGDVEASHLRGPSIVKAEAASRAGGGAQKRSAAVRHCMADRHKLLLVRRRWAEPLLLRNLRC